MNYTGRISLQKKLSSIRLEVAGSIKSLPKHFYFSTKTIKLAFSLFSRELDSMFLFRRATVIVTAAVLMLSTASGTYCLAAVKKSTASSSKISVPASMIKGSAVVSGRAFYKSSVPENSLAGIRLGRQAKEILARWGNPSRITVGQAQGEVAVSPTMGGPAYTPPSGGQYNPLATGLSAVGGMLGLPQLPGLGQSPQPMPQTPATQVLTEEEVTWTYDLTNGITLEFIITDGLITQITVGGSEPWGLSRTRTGIQLGDTYKLVLWVGGYPESQKYVGRFLRVSYVNKNRALFTFLNKKLVGITIAMVPSELN